MAGFLQDPRHVYLLAFLDGDLAGAAHAYLLLHPAGTTSLYIDEVDTLPAKQRRGVATTMMNELFSIAEDAGAEEAWLGADDGNEPAFALYRSLRRDEEEPGTIFIYKLENGARSR